MKKCLLCGNLDERDSVTCLYCGEATWEQLSAPVVPAPDLEPEEQKPDHPKHDPPKRGPGRPRKS